MRENKLFDENRQETRQSENKTVKFFDPNTTIKIKKKSLFTNRLQLNGNNTQTHHTLYKETD